MLYDTNRLVIEMGGDINNQLNMKKKLTKFPGNIVIVETDNDTRMSDGLFIVGDGNIEKAKNVLSSINTKTSYDVLRNWYNENV